MAQAFLMITWWQNQFCACFPFKNVRALPRPKDLLRTLTHERFLVGEDKPLIAMHPGILHEKGGATACRRPRHRRRRGQDRAGAYTASAAENRPQESVGQRWGRAWKLECIRTAAALGHKPGMECRSARTPETARLPQIVCPPVGSARPAEPRCGRWLGSWHLEVPPVCASEASCKLIVISLSRRHRLNLAQVFGV